MYYTKKHWNTQIYVHNYNLNHLHAQSETVREILNIFDGNEIKYKSYVFLMPVATQTKCNNDKAGTCYGKLRVGI